MTLWTLSTPAFRPLAFTDGLIADQLDKNYPCSMHGLEGRNWRTYEEQGSTFYGFVIEGIAQIEHAEQRITLRSGTYFAIPDKFFVNLTGGRLLVIKRTGYRGVFMCGGPVEQKGRLRYIDGCTDSLLLPPPKKGDPCLNLLHFPPNIVQTAHTHPSVRCGIVVRGRGTCWAEGLGSVQLTPGMLWCIETHGPHLFQTKDSMSELVVIAFHPDSDYGPSDEEHPMLNRTIVEGISARHLDAIRTGDDVEVQS